jgi:subtilisin
MNGLQTTPDELLEAAQAGGESFHTGRQIITFREGRVEEGLRLLSEAGATVAHSGGLEDQGDQSAEAGDADVLVFDELGVALIAGGSAAEEVASAEAGSDGGAIQAIEPETFVFPEGLHPQSYLAGFSAAAERIRLDLFEGGAAEPDEEDAGSLAAATWGLLATRAVSSRFSGRGIKVTVLDTGFDFRHPDFAGRPVVQRSFISGQPSQDGHGHGTHCTGTACGPRTPSGVPRYGIGYEALIHIGKVLSNSGSGTSAGVLAGMNWAVANRCTIISLSLGGPGGPYDYYTEAGRRALAAGCLIIAAAGNASARPGRIAPVIAPANSPTIMSVAALDERLQVARFSCGGKVDIAAPGVNVFSALPMPRRHGTMSGTSMATPHVAGVAALWAQSNPRLRGQELRTVLVRTARRLPFPPSDVGAGLVQAPVSAASPLGGDEEGAYSPD